MLDTIIPMLSDAFWGIMAFLGVINFFTGNGGPGSMTFAMLLPNIAVNLAMGI